MTLEEPGRPQTSLTSYITGVFNRRFSADIKRPYTSMGKLERYFLRRTSMIQIMKDVN